MNRATRTRVLRPPVDPRRPVFRFWRTVRTPTLMEFPTLATQPRPAHGSRASQKLRAQGLVPAIVYGHKQAAVAVALPQVELQTALRHHARVVELRLDGQTETAVIQEIQYDH